jgi:hypothetical protein
MKVLENVLILDKIPNILGFNRSLRHKLRILHQILHCKDKVLCRLVINKVIEYMNQYRYSSYSNKD